jgi:chemotaxis protein CheX
MRVEFINPFIASITKTFRTMLATEITRGQLYVSDHKNPIHEVSGMIGLSGHAVGMVVLSLSKEVALGAASTMLMCDCDEVNADVVDAVGELTNMVAGAAKAELEQYKLSISLPNVIVGRDYKVHFPTQVQPIVIPFDTQWGKLSLEVAFEVVQSPVSASV